MADKSSQRGILRLVAILGAVVLVAGAVCYMLAARSLADPSADSPLSVTLGVVGLVLAIVGAAAAAAAGLVLIIWGGRPISVLTLLLIPVGVGLDFALAALNKVLNTPLFLDSVGHILAGILGGPVIGGVTGFLGVLTNATFQPAAVVWCFQGAAIGVVVGLLAQAGMFKDVKRAIISGLIVVATSATLSSVISLVVFGGVDGYVISFIRVGLTNLGWTMGAAVVVTSVVLELIDKAISVGLPVLVIVAMSNRLLNQFVTGPKLRDMSVQTQPVGLVDETASAAAGGYGSYDDGDNQ